MRKCLFIALVTVVFAATGLLAETIDFEGFDHGAIPNTVHGGYVAVNGNNPDSGLVGNYAVVFDTSFATLNQDQTIDRDLGTPNTQCGGLGLPIDTENGPGGDFENCTPQGNALIIARNVNDVYNNADPTDETPDMLVDKPDDYQQTAADNVWIDFTFAVPVMVRTVMAIDFDGNAEPRVELFDGGDSLIGTYYFDNSDPGNGTQTISLGDTHGVMRMRVWLQGSGGIDNIVYRRQGGAGCTPGFWRNHFGGGKGNQDNYWPIPLTTLWGDEIAFDGCYPDLGSKLLTEAIWARGGGINRIQRHGTAALLNALSPDVNYPFTEEEVRAKVCSGAIALLVQANELSDECPAKTGED